MLTIGMMQGRLSPPLPGRLQGFPIETWREEFSRAAEASLAYLEWIYEVAGASTNPLTTSAGVAELQRLIASTGVRIPAICADYFMDLPLVRADAAQLSERERFLEWLIGQAAQLGVQRIVLPFVDVSRIATQEEFEQIAQLLNRLAPTLEVHGVELHLETDLPPTRFRQLLDACTHARIRANYDSGNSASLGYDPIEEWRAYGDRIGSVHIKDRLLGGGTVPLGTGAADFPRLREAIRETGYSGEFTLQVARGVTGDEVAWARANIEFVQNWWAAS